MRFSELIETDIYDTTILVQQTSYTKKRMQQSAILNEGSQYLHLMDLLQKMIRNKEMLAGLDGGFLAEPVSLNASLQSNYTPYSLYLTRQMETVCNTEISFPQDFSDYQRFMTIDTLSDLVLAIETYDFNAVLVKLHDNFNLFSQCASNYSAFLDGVKSWISLINLEYEEPGNDFIFEKVAAPILTHIEWYEANVLNPYKQNEISKLQLRDRLTDNRIADLVNSAENLLNSILSKFSDTLRASASALQTEFQTTCIETLRYLATFQGYFPNKQDIYLTLAKQMRAWQIPTATFEASDILSFQIPENETWRVWPLYMDIRYFVDNQINTVFKSIDKTLFDVIEDKLASIDRMLLDHVDLIDIHLKNLADHMDSLGATSVVDDEFVL